MLPMDLVGRRGVERYVMQCSRMIIIQWWYNICNATGLDTWLSLSHTDIYTHAHIYTHPHTHTHTHTQTHTHIHTYTQSHAHIHTHIHTHTHTLSGMQTWMHQVVYTKHLNTNGTCIPLTCTGYIHAYPPPYIHTHIPPYTNTHPIHPCPHTSIHPYTRAPIPCSPSARSS